MKRIVVLLVLALLISAGLFGLFWQHSHSLVRQLDQARAAVGTREASDLLEQLAQRHPDNAEVHFLHARQLRLEGRHDRALADLGRAAELGWPRAQVERELLLLRAQTEFRTVEPALQTLLETDPKDRDVLLALGLGWSRLHHFTKAEAFVNSLLEGDSGDGAAFCVRGRIRFQKGQPHDARPDLEKAVELGGGQYYFAEARLLLANCLLELGQFAAALQRFRDCQAEEPDSVPASFGMGRCNWYLGRWDEAAACFHEVLRLQPDHLDALSQLAYVHEERGELSQALDLLQKAAQSDPTWHDLYFRMAKIARALGQVEQAAKYEKHAEAVKKHWAKPRSGQAAPRGAYTGEDLKSPRAGEREPTGKKGK